jgi:UDP-galactopyranose mutase
MMYDYLIVGAGLAGSVMAERLASQLNKKVIVVEQRNHIGGNAFDEYDENGILVHRYGPHIFHTNSKKVFDYLSNFTEWRFYEHEVLANSKGKLFPIPINRITINKVYGLNLNTEEETRDYLENVRLKKNKILNSEDIIVNQVGFDLFEKFFLHYTRKQWNKEPSELSPIVCGRIPVRTNADCRYFTDKYQFMPKNGYTVMIKNMLSHPNIEIVLNTDYRKIANDIKFNKMIYTGPIDYFFDYKYGKLPYRSISFEYKTFDEEYYQPLAQVNYVDDSHQFTRVVEHKYLSGQNTKKTTVSFEYSQTDGDPFYPIPTKENKRLFGKYEHLHNSLKSVSLIGRLAKYQYYNMDQVIASALKMFVGKDF